jgi:Pyruvate/2-oxoacid:ferredoxin oxidoreductase gamma subunit
MERALLLTGLGGQGVQLAARTLAVAAIADGREAMIFGEYGGMMRGGNTDATVVIGTERLVTPPTVSHAWGAVAMHHEYWPNVERRMIPGGVVVIDSTVFRGEIGESGLMVVAVEASATATDLGNARGASMVALGALSAATGVVGVASLEAAIEEVLPPYRKQHARANIEAIRAGWGLVQEAVVDAWSEKAVTQQAAGVAP